MHYGHPDLADKLHFMTRGGISKASKSINLSEDVFAGYKTTLRGGRSIFVEYHSCGKGRGANFAEINGFFAKLSQGAAYQLQSRDVFRCSRLLPIERRASMFFSAFGFYVANAIVMYVVHITAYVYAILAVTNMMTTYAGMTTSLMVASSLMPLYAALILTFPDVLLCCVEEGPRAGFKFFVGKIVTLGPFYYLFVAQTRAYHMTNALRWGKAAYFSTKRTMSVAHHDFHELFMSYARSHIGQGLETFIMLMIAKHYNAPSDLGLRVWMYMFIATALVASPFLYNPLALVPSHLLRDMELWHKWVSRGGIDGKGDQGGKGQTWVVWWEAVTPKPSEWGLMAILGATLMSGLYALLALNILPQISRTVPLGQRELTNRTYPAYETISSALTDGPTAGHTLWPLSLAFICVVMPALLLAIFDTHADTIAKPHLSVVRDRLVKALTTIAVAWYFSVTLLLSDYVLGPPCSYQGGGAVWKVWHSVPVTFWNAIFLYLGLASLAYALAALQAYVPPVRYLLRLLQRMRDYLVFVSLMTCLCLLSACVLPHFIQKRILFQPSPIFFSRHWTGDLKAWAYGIGLVLGFVGLLLYLMLFTALGIIMPIASLDPFQCS